MTRILHIDMDAFFASIEQARNPALKQKPLVIGGTIHDKRGVVSTASYQARKFGIHSAMPLSQAIKLCPHAIFMRGDLKHYTKISKEIHQILLQVSPLVQMTSIDEGYIDITGSIKLFTTEDAIASHIKQQIYSTTRLHCTIAISPNKLISKIASAKAKPNGYLNIQEGDQQAFLDPLPLSNIPGIGTKTTQTLQKHGITKVHHLHKFTQHQLIHQFGKTGMRLHDIAQAKGSTQIQTHQSPKSISRETTFQQNKTNWNEIETILSDLTEHTLFTLRQKQLQAKRITLKIRNQHFKTTTYSHTLPIPTDQDTIIWKQIQQLLRKAKQSGGEVRLIGINISQLTNNQQQLLFPDDSTQTKQWEKAMKQVDHLRQRYGFNTLRKGKSLK